MSGKLNVYLTEPIMPEAQELLAANSDLDVGHAEIPPDELLARVAKADAILSKTDMITISAEVIAAAPKLRLIARHGSGFNNVDVEAANRRGIVVTYTPGAHAVTIAEYTVGLMLSSCRRLPAAVAATKLGHPDRLSFMGMEVFGKTFGVVGVGSIGREVVSRVHALGMRVLAYHPRPSASRLGDLPLELVDLDTLLRESDVVSVHVPLAEETVDLIGEPQLALMKHSAHLLNLARGGIVNEPAVRKALVSGRLAGYATDVTVQEPIPADDPLLSTPNAIILPHIAAVTKEAQTRVAMAAVGEVLRFSKGEPLHCVLNKEVLER